TGVVVLAGLTSLGMLLSARGMRDLMEQMASENLPSVRAAEELEIALLEQRGFVSYFILDDGDPAWLDELARREPAFQAWLVRAGETAHTEEERRIIEEIAAIYRDFDRKREEVIALYWSGERERARAVMLGDMASLYEQAYDRCEAFIAANERYVEARIRDGRRRVRQDMALAGGFTVLTTMSAVALLWLFFHGILRPLRRMAEAARVFSDPAQGVVDSPDDELHAVGFYLRELMSDVAEARTDLERSRGQLLSAEKLVSVGKLAASVAHEIRNPLTSLRMRLFWLQQQVGDDPRYEDEFRVVSEELARLESVIRNFLEFSRPPELQLGVHPVSALLDKTLELVGHRLVEKDIAVVRTGEEGLPAVKADAEQLKQVFINLILNAAEAMEDGGRLHIAAAPAPDGGRHGALAVRFRDTGSGVPADVRERIFEPFFSTKEHGTGLGLCIAASIMARHGGRLELESTGAEGTTFAVWIPLARPEDHGQDPDR
ncbi:MAG: ATP-binding protein, partial [Gemmatimonadota bacterium]